jgi:outer membrane protein
MNRTARHHNGKAHDAARGGRHVRRALVIALASLALIVSAMQSSYAADSRVITFDDAMRIALERNAALRQAEIAAAASAVTVDQARSQFLPDLSVSSRGGKSYGRTFNEAEGRVIDTSTDTVSLNASSSVTLFDGFSNTAELRQARHDEQASSLDLARARETVVFTVASNFLSLVQQQEQLRVRRESLAAESALERQIANFVDAGARTIADLYQQQAALASARLAVVEAERAAQLAEVDLIETLQLDPAGTYQFEPPAPADDATIYKEEMLLDRMLENAYAQRADLRAEENRLDAADQALKAAKGARWPTVSLSAGYGTNYTSASDFDWEDQFDQRRGGSVNLSIAVPIFNRGATRAAIRRAQLQAQSARLELETRRLDVGLEVRRAWLDFRSAREQLTSAEAQLKAAELALQAAQDRYQVGAATLVELSQARATQVQAASTLVSARSNLRFQRTLVDYYTGMLGTTAAAAAAEPVAGSP